MLKKLHLLHVHQVLLKDNVHDVKLQITTLKIINKMKIFKKLKKKHSLMLNNK